MAIELQSKKWKAIKAIGCGIMLLCMPLAIISAAILEEPFGFAVGLSFLGGIGLLMVMFGAIGSWWHHG